MLPIDFEKKQVFVQTTKGGEPVYKVDNQYEFPLIGVGRESGETGLKCLKREVLEESLGQLNIDTKKAIHIGEFIKDGDFQTFGYKTQEKFPYQDKIINIYLYPTNLNPKTI